MVWMPSFSHACFRATACVIAFSISICGPSWSQELDLAYEKVDHPPNLEGTLARIQNAFDEGRPALAKRTASQYKSPIGMSGAITVVLVPEHGKGSTSIDEAALEGIGADVLARSEHLVKVAVPVSLLTRLTEVPGVAFVRLPMRPWSGLVTSEGVQTIGAPRLHSKGYSGAGVKVAVIDNGFSQAEAAGGSGDLPTSWKYRDFTGEGIYSRSIHGTACAEIVHDVAPGAEIYMMKVGSLVDLENAKNLAIHEGVGIVTVSLAWLGTGFGDGLGFACNVVNDAFENGVLWVNSAGNYATSQYSGMMRDVDSDGYHDFDEGMEVLGLQDVRVGDEIDIWLTWNDWPSTKQDYDLLLVRLESDGSYRAVEKSDTKQVIDPPQEHLTHIVASPGQYGIVVWRARDALIRMFKVLSRYHDFEKHASVTGTISIPADAHGALTVGAINYTNWLTGPVETFSSQGPTVDGRVKPDLVAPDGVTTTGYGSGGFFGTSAAAPHVGGAAALLKSTNPTHYTAQRLWQALTDAAVDMGVRGRDNVYGWGRLDLSSILQGTPDIELSVAALAFGNATIGGSKSQSFIVKNTGNASLLVDEMTVASHQMDYEVFPASFSVAPNRIRTATVTFTPSTEGAKSTTLTVSSNDPGTPLATVSLSGSATKVPPPPSPEIALPFTSIELDSVLVGASSSTSVLISNRGNAPLVVSGISSSDEQFGASPSVFTVADGGGQPVRIIFGPLTPGQHEAAVTIASDDPSRPTLTLSVTAVALPKAETFSVAVGAGSPDDPQVVDSFVTSPNTDVQMHIIGDNLSGAVGFSALFEYDPSQVQYAKFRTGEVIPKAHSPGPHYRTSPHSVEVAAASFGDRIGRGHGVLGTLVLRTQAAFTDTEVRLELVRLRREGGFEIITSPAALLLTQQTTLQGDFDGDGQVDFGDFVLFAQSFGATEGIPSFDARYDLDGDKHVGFSDFVIFAQSFGKKLGE